MGRVKTQIEKDSKKPTRYIRRNGYVLNPTRKKVIVNKKRALGPTTEMIKDDLIVTEEE
jgi:hypothetical protein